MHKIPPTSQEIYDALAPYYKHYSDNKSRYLATIDRLLLANLPMPNERILDIGCGDGRRATDLFTKSRASEIWMIDNSRKMYERARAFEGNGKKVFLLDMLSDKSSMLQDGYFDSAWCLWNVLGHVTRYSDRVKMVGTAARVLRKGGRLLIDVSNRYNFAYYGFKIAGKNVWEDMLRPNPDNGTVEYIIHAEGANIPSYCHFFNPNEIPNLAKLSGLTVRSATFVNYESGNITNIFSGHIFYVLEKE